MKTKSQVVCTIWPYNAYYGPVKERLSDFDRDKRHFKELCALISQIKLGTAPFLKVLSLHTELH